MASKISVQHLFKVFGPEPDYALELLESNMSKDDIMARTGQTVAVQDVSFDVDQGEIFVVMGLSGSGKSTLVRMLNRLIAPTAGAITIDGEDVLALSDSRLRRLRLEKMAMVFQHFALFPHKSVAENVAYGLKIRGIGAGERRERALQALDQVRLGAWADYRPEALSGGMQQRVGLARGLAADPEILLMDEPFSALDPLIRRDMQLELLELQNKLKKTIVFITHDLNEALILGDHIAIMKEGRFVQVGTAPEIVGNPADDYVAAFTRDVERARVFTCEAVMEDAHALDLAADTPQTALERMNGLDRTALYARDDGRLAGIVTYRDLIEATHRNGTDLCAIVSTDYPTASPDTHLYRLYGECARGLPIAILGEDGGLVAVAEPEAVFAKLAVSRDGDGQSAETDAHS